MQNLFKLLIGSLIFGAIWLAIWALMGLGFSLIMLINPATWFVIVPVGIIWLAIIIYRKVFN